jgi:hypothetical protein
MSNNPGQNGAGGGTGPGAGGGSHSGQGNQAPEGKGGQTQGDQKNSKGGGVVENQTIANPGQGNANAVEDDSSSSPLVPILIAIVVLAAISIGAYYYRQRRQGADPSVSPKAS